MTLDIKPNCKGSVEITEGDSLELVSELYNWQIVGISIEFVAEIYHIPGRIFTSDPADSSPDEFYDERRVTSIELALEDGSSLKVAMSAAIAEQIELACEDEIYGAEVK